MAKVKILVEGYVREKGGSEYASSTATYVEENGVKMIVDPGMDRGRLLRALKREKLTPANFDYVILTHLHPDHSLLAALFLKACIVFDTELYFWNGKITRHPGRVPKTKVKILSTPGHDPFHSAVVAQTPDLGKVVVAGDLFWWPEGEKRKVDYQSLIKRPDPYLKDKQALEKSRALVLKQARYIIPGHGLAFTFEH